MGNPWNLSCITTDSNHRRCAMTYALRIYTSHLLSSTDHVLAFGGYYCVQGHNARILTHRLQTYMLRSFLLSYLSCQLHHVRYFPCNILPFSCKFVAKSHYDWLRVFSQRLGGSLQVTCTSDHLKCIVWQAKEGNLWAISC